MATAKRAATPPTASTKGAARSLSARGTATSLDEPRGDAAASVDAPAVARGYDGTDTRGRGVPGFEWGGGVWEPPEDTGPGRTDGRIGPAKGAIACANSATVANRSVGSLESARWTASCSPFGTSSRNSTSGGVGSATIDAAAAVVLPSNGVRPARSSYRMTPSDQMSVRKSTSRADRTCSGDMYSGVPTEDCVWVSFASPSSAILEIPKSRTLTIHSCLSEQRKRFDGLRSRCTIPAA